MSCDGQAPATPPAVPSSGAGRCPGCGQPNGCALAAGEPMASCWCLNAPPLGGPAPKAGLTCFCPTCLARRREAGTAS